MMTRLVLFFSFICCFTINAELRVWTRASDERTIKASFVSADIAAGMVKLKLANGSISELKISVLSQDDQNWIKQAVASAPVGKKEAHPVKLEKHKTEGVRVGRWFVRYPAGVKKDDYKDCPLCVLYNAGGNSKTLIERVSLAADDLGWILVGVDAYSNGRVEKGYQKMEDEVRKVLGEVFKKIPHHKKKVIFGGFSGGAWWSYVSTAELYPKAAGVLAFGGWMSRQYDRPYPRKLTVAMVNGDKDRACRWEERDGEFLRKKKRATTKVFHFPGGHVIASPEITHKAAKWLHQTAGFDTIK